MLRDSDLMRARDALMQEPDIKARYPTLAQDPDWPRQQTPAPSVLSNAQSREQEQFWHEVRERAEADQARPVPAQTPEIEPSPSDFPRHETTSPDLVPAADLNQSVRALWEKMQSALTGSEQERQEARAIHAKEYQRTFEQMHARLAQVGILSLEGARLWEQIEGRFRISDFYDLLAEAHRIEAKRNERGQMPEATPAQKRQVERSEREEQLREGVEFKPQPVARPLPEQGPMAQARRAMAEEYRRPAEPQPTYSEPAAGAPARSSPPDPFTLLAQRGEAATAAHATAKQAVSRQALDPYSLLPNRDDRAHSADSWRAKPQPERRLPPNPYEFLPPKPGRPREQDVENREQTRSRDPQRER